MYRRIHPNSLSLAAGILFLMLLPNALRAQNEADTDQALLAEQGEAIFQKQCSTCHTIGGGDTPMGPDLAGVTDRRDRQWLRRIIREPEKLIAEGDPVAQELKEEYGMVMPAMGLSQDELEAVIAFLTYPAEEEHRAGEASTGKPQKEMKQGKADRGRDLYVGTASFENSGAPCLACHGIGGAGLGMAAGANYGPDLTNLYENYGPAGVVSILETLPFPSMKPIYADRPLTQEEQQDLSAFFKTVSAREPVRVEDKFVLQAGGVFLAFALILYVFGRYRLNRVRRSLVEEARQKTKGDMR